ncbi:MAG: von Willebrand factor type A domain-containing protein, partial [Pseudomonas sp.]|uniref:vWA domain-containing protein n=1 Tax=Pseudomonas sp. TaxID=306 RepID=UPI0030F02BBF
MAHYFALSRTPLLYGFAGGLLLALTACSVKESDSAVAKNAPMPAAPVVYADASLAEQAEPAELKKADPNASYAPAAVAPRRMLVPAPSRDTQSADFQSEYREQYQKLADNPIHAVAQEPVSTFSIDVDTGSYANVRRFLNRGQLPPGEAVRLEELVNYFPYSYPQAAGNTPFGVSTELAVTPWNANSRLLKVAIKASDLQSQAMPPANLVFLVDVSGSMDRPDGLPLVQSTLKLLVEQLRGEDKVSLVVYAGDSSVVLPPTSGSEKGKIRAAIDKLQAGGSTAGESGIRLAYEQ